MTFNLNQDELNELKNNSDYVKKIFHNFLNNFYSGKGLIKIPEDFVQKSVVDNNKNTITYNHQGRIIFVDFTFSNENLDVNDIKHMEKKDEIIKTMGNYNHPNRNFIVSSYI